MGFNTSTLSTLKSITIIVIHLKSFLPLTSPFSFFLTFLPLLLPLLRPLLLPLLLHHRYPNDFWGWGGEDDALKHRLDDSGIEFR